MATKCHMHPKYDAVNCPGCTIILLESEIDDKHRLILEMREGLQEIYSHHGEDEHIEKIASPLIDKAS